MQRNKIGLTQQPLERDIVGMICRSALMKQDAQPKATRPLRDGLPDCPIANETQRFAIEQRSIPTSGLKAAPATGSHVTVGLRKPSGDS